MIDCPLLASDLESTADGFKVSLSQLREANILYGLFADVCWVCGYIILYERESYTDNVGNGPKHSFRLSRM